MAVLTIALLILMRTRWGQVQPLSKCVVLSVFAHILLFLFAYGTRLLEVHTPAGGDDAIQLAFVATDRPPREGEELAEEQPWEEFLPGETTEPDASESQRLEVEGESVTRSAQVDAWAMGTDPVPQAAVPAVEPARPIAEHQIPTPQRPTQSLVQAAAMELPSTLRRVNATPAVPEASGPDRIETTAVVRRSVDQQSEVQLPTEIFAMGSRMQQLADVDARGNGRCLGRQDGPARAVRESRFNEH